jgi:hypothetical protein
MQLIETITLTSSANTITFSSIPQTYTDLLAVISARSDVADTAPLFFLRVNDQDATNRTAKRLNGSGSAVFIQNPTDNRVGSIPGSNATANTFGNTSIYFANYSTALVKSFGSDSVTENNATAASQNLLALRHNITEEITSLVFSGGLDNFVAGSTISLYGILKGSDGITTAT